MSVLFDDGALGVIILAMMLGAFAGALIASAFWWLAGTD